MCRYAESYVVTVSGCDVVLAAADHADLDAEARAQKVVPLAHQIERRRDDQRAAPLVVDRQHTRRGSCRRRSAARRRRVRALAPGVERLGLERPRLAAHAQPVLELGVAPRLVVEVYFGARQRAHDVGVRDRGSSKGRRARVPAKRGGQLVSLGNVAELERAGREIDPGYGSSRSPIQVRCATPCSGSISIRVPSAVTFAVATRSKAAGCTHSG